MALDTLSTKTNTTYLLSTFICVLGAHSILSPIPASLAYGIPMHPDNDKWQYVPVMGARSFALGAAAGILTYRGQRRAAGIVLSTAGIVGPVDVWACWSAAGAMTKEAWGHVFGDGLFAVAGLWLAIS